MSATVFTQLGAVDFGPFAQLQLDLEQRGLVIIEGENEDTSSANSNGAGKSHIFKAITWCIHGETVEGDKGDRVIRHGRKLTIVSVGWRDDAGEWIVTRTKPRGSTGTLKLEHNNQDVSAPTIAGTQAEITRRLGLDYQTWRNTVLYAQGDLVRFADPTTTDTERKAILKRILRLDILDRAADTAKAKLKVIDSALQKLNTEMVALEAEMRGLSDGAALAEQLKVAEAEALAEDKKAKRLPKLRELESQIKEVLDGIQVRRRELGHAEANAILQDTAQRAHMLGVAREQAGRFKELEETIYHFNEGHCPTCQAPATMKHIKKLLDGYEQQAATALRTEQEARSEAQAAEERIKAVKRSTLAATEELNTETAEWQPKLTEVRRSIALAEQAINSAAQARRRATSARDQLDKLKGRRESLEAKARTIHNEAIPKLDTDKRHLDFWVRGLSNTGLSSYMMDSVVPELTERANHYLEILADGDIQVQFDTQSKLKSGESREKLAIQWVIEGIPEATPSGGQRKKISIAVDLALMDLVAARERASIDLLLMDEVLDGLDATGKSRIMALLAELRTKRSSIFVISHDSGISELFEHAVTVRKTNSQSVLEDS